MFDKRLFSLVPGLKRQVAAKVACLWLNLLANITLVFAITSLLGTLLMAADRHTPKLGICLPGNDGKCLDMYDLAYAFWPAGDGTDSDIWETYWPAGILWIYLAIFVAIALVKFFATRAATRFGTQAAESVKLALRERLYAKMLSLGPSYRQRVKTSDIVQSASEGIDQIQSFYELFLPQLFYAILAPLTLFCVVAPINLPSAIVLLVCAPLIVIIVGLVAMSASRVFKKYWGRYTDMGSLFLDDLQGLETLKNFGADGDAARKMDEEAENFRVMTMKVLQIQLRSLTAMDVVAYGGAAAGIGTAIWQYLHNGVTHLHLEFGTFAFMDGHLLTVAGVFIIVLLSADFFLPLRQLGSYFHVAMNGMTSTKRIFALLDAPEPERGTENLEPSAGPFTLELKGVSYSYDDVASQDGDSGAVRQAIDGARMANANAPIHESDQTEESVPLALKNVTFTAKPGTLTAIVGASGSGKTTLGEILAGTLTGYRGEISVKDEAGKGTELGNLNVASLSRDVTLVGATSRLFAGTLRENLLMAKPDATDDEMMDALKRAHVDAFVAKQPAGLDMPIEQDSANLSGGQRQRLAMARALLHDSPIMIFDEVTSSVDVESEEMILATIRELAATKTVLLITHRLANAEDAGQVIVMAGGRNVETGTHEALMAADGLYAKMFRTQASVENVGRREGAAGLEYGAAVTDGSAGKGVGRNRGVATAGAGTGVGAGTGAGVGSANGVDPVLEHDATGMTNREVVDRMIGEVRPLRRSMALACAFGTIGHLAATFVPVFGVIAIFVATGNKVWGMGLSMAVSLMVACALIRGFMRYAEQYMNHNVAFRLLALFRHKSFAALRRLAPGKLEGRGKGDLIALVTTDVELLEIFFAHTISPVIIAITTSVLYIIAAFALFNPWTALLMVVAYLVLGVALPALFSRSLKGVGGAIRADSAALGDQILDDMRGLGELIHFGAGEKRQKLVTERSKRLWAEHDRLSDRNGVFGGLGNVLVIVFTVLGAFVCIVTAMDNPANIAFDVTAFTLFISSFGPTLALSALPANLTQTFAAARRLFALIDADPAVRETGTKQPAYDGMTMQAVTFRYTDANDGADLDDVEAALASGESLATVRRRRAASGASADRTGTVLENFSLEVPVHGILGVQGPSGRGKSTMLKLLMRYWDPQAGTVYLSTTPLPDVDAHARRREQAMMGQETYLFDGTIRQNLQLADGGATDERLREALRKASALELVESLPDGLDTRVGELGSRLSEGERQRIGLARVFLRRADLVLLDEPTSRLDALNEAFILQSVNELASAGVAVLLVSHRESTMRVADKVLRM